jgi:hypothetical protein
MTTTNERLIRVREFQEERDGGPPRRHVLAIYETGQVRVLIDRGEHMATRLLAILNDGQERAELDSEPQIEGLCDEYVRHYLRFGGPLACRLSNEHLAGVRRRRRADDADLAFAA